MFSSFTASFLCLRQRGRDATSLYPRSPPFRRLPVRICAFAFGAPSADWPRPGPDPLASVTPAAVLGALSSAGRPALEPPSPSA